MSHDFMHNMLRPIIVKVSVLGYFPLHINQLQFISYILTDTDPLCVNI